MTYDLGSRIQSADFNDRHTVTDISARVRQYVDFLDNHAAHEDKHVFPVLRLHEPQPINALESQHRSMELKEQAVLDQITRVERATSPEEAAVEGAELHMAFNTLAAATLMHMLQEEQTAQPVAWNHLSDADIMGIRAAIQADTPIERYADWLRWMLPAINIQELTGMLGGVKASVPPPVFDQISAIASQSLDPQRWMDVKERIGA